MTITVTFDPPLPSDSPATFNTKAFTLLGDLNTWSTQANAVAVDVTQDEVALAAAVSAASGSASAASGSASSASTSASTATTQAGIATTKAGEASASAAAAAASAASVNLGNVDINGGTIDGTVIGGSSAAAGSFTTLSAIGNVTLGDSDTDTITPNAVLVNNIPLKWKSTWPFAAGSHGAWIVKGTDDNFYVDNFEGNTVFRRGSYAVSMTIDSAGAVTIPGTLSLTGGTLGYGTGAGGTVTQATSKSTAVTLNKPCGQITMNNAALAAGGTVLFQVTNSLALSSSIVVVNANANPAGEFYSVWCSHSFAGGFFVCIRNITAVPLSDALVLNFALLTGATS